MRTACHVLLCSLLLVPPAVAQHDTLGQAGSASYITHVTVIDTETGKESRDQTVVISAGRISEVKDSTKVKPAAGAKVVDGTGKYLIPGLWDMHVHRSEYESTYPMYIANGVTGVRDMAGPPDANKFRAKLAAEKIDAPHIYLGSPIVDGYPPRWPEQIAVRNAEEARNVVDDQKRKGADFIKVYDRLSRESYFAIADEARRQQIPFVGHVPFAISAWEASTSGQRSIEHMHAVPLACSSREAELRARLVASPNSWKLWNAIYLEAYQSYSDAKCQRLFGEFRQNRTWMVPTLVVFRSAAFSNDAQFRNDDRLRYFGGQIRLWLSRQFVAERTNFDTNDIAVERDLFARRKALVGKEFRAHILFLAGTDTPNPFVFPGFALHDELALLAESGLTPLAALQAATRNPAIFMNATDRYGSISKGKIGDLVLLDADPLQDIHNTTKIAEVFLDGKEYDRAALDLILKNAEQEANGSLKLSPEEQQAWRQEETHWRLLKADDTETYMQLWDNNFTGWPKYDGATIDKEGIRSELANAPASRGRVVNYELQPLSVRAHGSDVVITFYRVTVSRAMPNGEVQTSTSRLTHTWMKTDQGWTIIGGMSADDNPLSVSSPSNRQTPSQPSSLQPPGKTETLVMPGPDVQNLMLGTWATHAKYPTSSDNPTGDTGEGTEVWRPGPGGRSVIEESRERNSKGEVEGIGIAWWDKQARGQRFVWCDNSNPDGCYVSKEVAKWDGEKLEWKEEQETSGKKHVYSKVFKDIRPDSFTQVLQEGAPGEALKDTATISAKRISQSSISSRNETDLAEAELGAVMAELRKASIEGDVDTIENSMTDDYVQTDINGYRQDKSTWLNEYFRPLADLIKAGKFHWDVYERTNLQFRFYGNCAVVTGELHAKGTGAKFGPQHTWVADPNASFSGTLHFTHVYIKQNGKWMLAALHNQMPLPPANSAK